MKYIKYNRTYHLPYSETITEDDKRLKTDIHFIEMDSVVCTIKMDEENSSIYPDGYIHARSLDGNKYPWQTWLKKYIQNWCIIISYNLLKFIYNFIKILIYKEGFRYKKITNI